VKVIEEKPIDRCPVMSTLQGRSLESDQTIAQADGTAVVAGSPSAAFKSVKRLGLMLVGLLLVLLAAIGVVLPGIPATGPLILASICLTKSCPWLEQRLVRSRFFAPFHRYLDGNAEMPWKARVAAIFMMWTAITISSMVLLRSDTVGTWVVVLIVSSGVFGTVVITRYGRNRQRAA